MYPIEDIASRIVSHANGLIVLNKPHDIPTSGRTLDDPDSVQFWLQKFIEKPVWAVHQLDADTTGINLFVTEKKLVPLYQNHLSHGDSKKIYGAIVHGSPSWNQLTCEEPIGYVSERSLGVTPEGKSAHSRFTVLDCTGDFSLIQAEIFTGRTHQIRIHLNHLGFPLVGEEWYTNRPVRAHYRQALHSWKLELNSGEQFTAPFPQDFRELAEHEGLKMPL